MKCGRLRFTNCFVVFLPSSRRSHFTAFKQRSSYSYSFRPSSHVLSFRWCTKTTYINVHMTSYPVCLPALSSQPFLFFPSDSLFRLRRDFFISLRYIIYSTIFFMKFPLCHPVFTHNIVFYNSFLDSFFFHEYFISFFAYFSWLVMLGNTQLFWYLQHFSYNAVL